MLQIKMLKWHFPADVFHTFFRCKWVTWFLHYWNICCNWVKGATSTNIDIKTWDLISKISPPEFVLQKLILFMPSCQFGFLLPIFFLNAMAKIQSELSNHLVLISNCPTWSHTPYPIYAGNGGVGGYGIM